MALVIVVACGLTGCGSGDPVDAPRPVATRPSVLAVPQTHGRAEASPAVLTPGAYGVRSSWVAAENAKRGSRSWRITDAPRTGFIKGFADRTYVARGQQVVLRVSTTAPSFRVTAYRIGWYGGAGARAVWHSPRVTGHRQPPCTLTRGVNLVSCQRWKPSLTIPVTAAFVQGDYLFKLVGSGHQQGYVPMTVWDPRSRATYLVKNDVFTWQAWNTYGGYDYYNGPGTCPPGIYPLCTRARVVSFDRPYDQQGAGSFLGLEAPLVRFLERHHLDVAYATDVTVAQHPEILSRHRVVLSLGHDECWSLNERRAAVRARRHGTGFAFFGASAMLRHVRLERSRLGPDRLLVDYRDSAADPLNHTGRPGQVTGNTWSDPPASWPEGPFVGESYNGFLEPGRHEPLTVTDAASWAFRGTGLRNGDRLQGVIASDVDSVQPGLGAADVRVLARSPLATTRAQAVGFQGGTFYSDMTFYVDPASDAGIWDSGTNNWIPALDAGPAEPAGAAAAVRRVTGNVLRRLAQPTVARP